MGVSFFRKNSTEKLFSFHKSQRNIIVYYQNASSCAGHRVRPNNTSVRVWSRERFIEVHTRRQVTHTLKASNSLKDLGKALF